MESTALVIVTAPSQVAVALRNTRRPSPDQRAVCDPVQPSELMVLGTPLASMVSRRVMLLPRIASTSTTSALDVGVMHTARDVVCTPAESRGTVDQHPYQPCQRAIVC